MSVDTENIMKAAIAAVVNDQWFKANLNAPLHCTYVGNHRASNIGDLLGKEANLETGYDEFEELWSIGLVEGSYDGATMQTMTATILFIYRLIVMLDQIVYTVRYPNNILFKNKSLGVTWELASVQIADNKFDVLSDALSRGGVIQLAFLPADYENVRASTFRGMNNYRVFLHINIEQDFTKNILDHQISVEAYMPQEDYQLTAGNINKVADLLPQKIQTEIFDKLK